MNIDGVLHRYNQTQIAAQKYQRTYDNNNKIQHHINIPHHGLAHTDRILQLMSKVKTKENRYHQSRPP